MCYLPNSKAPGYWTYNGLEIHADLDVHKFVRKFASENIPVNSPVLDIAAGSGALASQLCDIGMNVSCTSWNGKSELSLSAYTLDLDFPFNQQLVGGQEYKLVSAIEIIEHLENPSLLIRSLRDVVAPDGFVIISTPNVESALARLEWLRRGCPYSFDSWEVEKNRHISMMWRQGLEFLFDLGGFEIFEKHLLGEPRFSGFFQTVVKKPIIKIMESVLSGDIKGNTRLYVLRPVPGKIGSRLGPNDVA